MYLIFWLYLKSFPCYKDSSFLCEVETWWHQPIQVIWVVYTSSCVYRKPPDVLLIKSLKSKLRVILYQTRTLDGGKFFGELFSYIVYLSISLSLSSSQYIGFKHFIHYRRISTITEGTRGKLLLFLPQIWLYRCGWFFMSFFQWLMVIRVMKYKTVLCFISLSFYFGNFFDLPLDIVVFTSTHSTWESIFWKYSEYRKN